MDHTNVKCSVCYSAMDNEGLKNYWQINID